MTSFEFSDEMQTALGFERLIMGALIRERILGLPKEPDMERMCRSAMCARRRPPGASVR
jgi:hypothetical protein